MTLSDHQKKFLRGLGHQLKPAITVGDKGLTAALCREFSSTIDHHELIKVRIKAADREARDALFRELCEGQSAEMVTRIGNVGLIYRRNDENARITLPRR